MRIDTISLFPDLIDDFFQYGVIGRAVKQNIVKQSNWNLRSFGSGAHLSVDNKPFGGGPGMILRCEPLAKAIQTVQAIHKSEGRNSINILTSASAQIFDQKNARSLADDYDGLIIVCGRYEGVDQRIVDLFIDCELSVGSFVVSGGELPACLIIDSVCRLLPGVLGNSASAFNDSYCDGETVEHHQYTRPRIFQGLSVPSVLMSGDEAKIKSLQASESRQMTEKRKLNN